MIPEKETTTCTQCLKQLKKYDFVLPPTSGTPNDMCRKCHHKNQNIDDDDYEHYILLYRQVERTREVTNALRIKIENDIANGVADEPGRATSEQMLDFCEYTMQTFAERLRTIQHRMSNIEKWAKLVARSNDTR